MKGINIDDNNKRYLSYQIMVWHLHWSRPFSIDTSTISSIILRILDGFPYY